MLSLGLKMPGSIDTWNLPGSLTVEMALSSGGSHEHFPYNSFGREVLGIGDAGVARRGKHRILAFPRAQFQD
jgi:hypothetical protein